MADAPLHFAVGSRVLMAPVGIGHVVGRDHRGGMTVQWDCGHVTTERPFALSHETSVFPPEVTP